MLLIEIMKKISNDFENIDKLEKNIFLININSKIISTVFFYKYDIIENIFLEPTTISKLEIIYNKAKNILNILNKFSKDYKQKKYIKFNSNVDLYFNNLNKFNDNHIIKIIDNKTIYRFRLSNLILMWKDALFNCENLFPIPLKLKNPYTNVIFSNSILYHIYNSILNTNFIVPTVITFFLKSHFNLSNFKNDYFSILKDNAIQKFITNGSYYEKYEQINNMFYYYSKEINYIYLNETNTSTDKIIVTAKLLNILKYYLFARYSCNPSSKTNYYSLAKINLLDFLKKNKTFVTLYCSTVTHTNVYLPPRPSTIPPPPPPLHDRPIASENSSVSATNESLDTLNRIINRPIVNYYNNNRTNDYNFDPFTPTTSLPRTP